MKPTPGFVTSGTPSRCVFVIKTIVNVIVIVIIVINSIIIIIIIVLMFFHLQREFTCCGGYGYAQGYTDWKHTSMGGARFFIIIVKKVVTKRKTQAKKIHSSMGGARFQVSCSFEVSCKNRRGKKSRDTVLIIIMFCLSHRNSVPDSCCLFESPGCGSDLFAVNDLRVIFAIIVIIITISISG